MKKQNIFANIPENLDNEIFEEIFTKKDLKVERIISYGHITPEDEWYNQNNDEWVMVLEGEAMVSFKNRDAIKLKSGDYINIPAHTQHRVSWSIANKKTIWLAIHY